MRAKPPAAFKTRSDIARYFGGNTIECLICGRRFKRLHTHLAAKHGMAADDYKKRFGLPWTRGLTSATSLANSGWTDERKAKARKLAQKSRFFDLAHSTPRRELAPFLKTEAVEARSAAHDSEFRRWPDGVDRRICQTFAASPAEPGELPLGFRGCGSRVVGQFEMDELGTRSQSRIGA